MHNHTLGSMIISLLIRNKFKFRFSS